jgi:CRP-like cAMP-binding protein
MAGAATLKALAGTDLFAGLGDPELAAIASSGVERTFKKGQILFSAGDPGDALYVLLEGSVKGYVTSEDGTELIVGILEAPAVFGEVAVGDGGARSAGIEVVAPSRVLVIERRGFLAALKDNPGLAESYIAMLVAMIRRLQERTEGLVFLDLQGRVAKLLLGSIGDDAGVDLNVTQGELAAMVGGSRPSVNQVLKAFESRGYLTLDGKKLVINDRAALERLSSL